MHNEQSTLAELATELPAASRVFHRYHLDFCCGGRARLAEACAARDLNAQSVLAEILAAPTSDDAPRPERLDTPALVAHIVERYHSGLIAEVERLATMAAKVERVHGDKPTCPRGLAAHLARTAEELTSHLAKEENILFPMLVGGAGVIVRGPIAVMLREHDDHGANLRRTRELTADLVAPPEACNTWRALYLGLDALERELMEHIHVENNVLFPRALAG